MSGKKITDLTGQRFGRLLVLSQFFDSKGNQNSKRCMVLCDCGVSKEVAAGHLTSGHTRSCGCLNRETTRPPSVAVGERYGRLVILSHTTAGGQRRTRCTVQCDCGTVKTVAADALRDGRIVSCGCLKVERGRTLNRTHGMSKTNEYAIWSGMKDRIFNPNNQDWEEYYGGHGIEMCQGIKGDFTLFYRKVGPRPSTSHSIDRKDNLGHYSCGECEQCLANGWPFNLRWATWLEQQNNRRPWTRRQPRA